MQPLPQRFKLFSGNANRPLAQLIARELDMELGAAQVDTFPDGETCVRIDDPVRGEDIFVIQSTCFPANQNILELLIMMDALKRASAARITAVIPFYGYARQDRKDQPRVPITAKLIANLLVTAGANRVLTLDLHAQQIQGFFDIPVDHLYASPVFYDYLKGLQNGHDLMVVAPDVGSIRMAAAYAQLLNTPLGFVAKRRTNATTVQAISLVGEVAGKDVLLIDDMTETAGTLTAAAQIVKHAGARSIKALVTHCMLNDLGKKRLQASDIQELITTDSTPVQAQDFPITVLSVASLFAQDIRCIHENKSMNALFKTIF